MMSAAPPFLLTREQALRLQAYIQTYHRYILTSLLPSNERNTTLRVLQAVQGKLFEAMDQAIQPTSPLPLLLTREEMTTVRAAVTDLLSLYSKQPESAERIATLSDLAALKASLKMY